MAENSKIQWTNHTANLWWGCTKVHAGCDNCYAEALSHRFGDDVWGNDKPRRAINSVWKDLAKYQRKAKEAGEIHRVFVGSMMDIFEKPMPLINNTQSNGQDYYTTGNLRSDLFSSINDYPNLMFLFLTKRPSNINKMIPEEWKENPPANVMFGTSPVDQETADKLIPQLMEVKGKKFLSVEPMLGPINLDRVLYIDAPGSVFEGDNGPDWIICGGESGPGKREFDPAWARSIRDQCAAAGVPFFMKQWDKVKEIPEDLMIREFPF